ncbi:MAG: flagellar motor protein MotB [Terracidiphilus sp.]
MNHSPQKPRDENKSVATGVDIGELQRQLELAIGKEIRNHEVIMRVTPEGFVISLKDMGFFNSGEARLLPGAADKIERIAKVLSQHGLELRVEGHSDDQPIHTPEFRSNWELSTARAMAVLMMLIDDSGIDPKKVSVAGYGQFRPIADNATSDGRQMNRRVDLVVVATTNQSRVAQ